MKKFNIIPHKKNKTPCNFFLKKIFQFFYRIKIERLYFGVSKMVQNIPVAQFGPILCTYKSSFTGFIWDEFGSIRGTQYHFTTEGMVLDFFFIIANIPHSGR